MAAGLELLQVNSMAVTRSEYAFFGHIVGYYIRVNNGFLPYLCTLADGEN